MGLLDGTTQNQYYSGNDHGNYQFTSLENVINQFMVAYVGEDKIISKVKRSDVAFHAQRALAELSFDTLKSIKSQEIEVPATLQMILPQDYVNYTKISSVDSAGIKHRLYPTLCNTSNPTNPIQDANGNYQILAEGTFTINTDTIVLDKEYSNIQCGMVVKSSHVPGGVAVIYEFSSDGTFTTIKLGDFSPQNFGQIASLTTFDSQETGVFDIIIENKNGSLINSENSSYTAINLTPINSLDNYITVSTADAANIEVGMIVAASTNVFIPQNTFVTAVNDTKVTISNPTQAPAPSTLHVNFISPTADSDTWGNYKSHVPSENNNDDYEDDIYWKMKGNRYGIDPQYAQANGSFYIDDMSGKIHFSSNISGKTVILDYISDSLGTDAEMQVHKFAEEAMYKCIAYAVLSTRVNTQEYIVRRYKKEKFAETRKAKLRLSNIKLEEITQILRGKSKRIKH
mgnify:FL=1